MNTDDPFQPRIPPRISSRKLWLCLATPPSLILIANLLIPFLGMSEQYFSAWLVTIPIILLGFIPGLAFHFKDAVGVRYRGRSLQFLVWSFILGEMIVCSALSVGSCVAVSYHYKSP